MNVVCAVAGRVSDVPVAVRSWFLPNVPSTDPHLLRRYAVHFINRYRVYWNDGTTHIQLVSQSPN